jgi:hypothetical protein
MPKFYTTLSTHHLSDLRLDDDKDQRFSELFQLLIKDNPVMNDMLFLEASDRGNHLTMFRDRLPEVNGRSLNTGAPPPTPPTIVYDPIGMVEGRINSDDLLWYINSYEHIINKIFKDMLNNLTTAIFYGSNKASGSIRGLAERYPYKDGKYVIDAGGSGSNCTSVWIVIWGENDAYLIYPQGSGPGLGLKLWPEADYPDGKDGCIRAPRGISWSIGLSLRFLPAVVRICNIDVDRLRSCVNSDEAYSKYLTKLLIKAKNKIPFGKLASAVIYMNSDVFNGLDLSAGPNCEFRGVPVRQVDAILSTEEALPACPVENGSAQE